jgi:uncharacterized protein YgbK (DUF1537 family)
VNTGQNILLAFYGDDLTGSTDALEFICRAGAKAVLFMEPPTVEQVQSFKGLQAFGVAGLTRSLSPEKMEEVLLPAFEMMKATGARHVHYKVCSTFDSSPETGSIGKAIDCGAAVFQNGLIPVLGGMPALGRYCVFGNLFARMGIGSNGKIYRLDRHPSMSKHPVTPAHESDLRLHLRAQTEKKIGLIDIVEIEKDIQQWQSVIQSDEEVVLLDVLKEEQLTKIGEWLDTCSGENRPLFSVGSSGIEMALGNYWKEKGLLQPTQSWSHLERAEPLLVISGSCSPVTAAQIGYAKANGFEEVVLPAKEICAEELIETGIAEQVLTCLQQRKHVIVHTGTKDGANLSSEWLGTALGLIAKEAVQKTEIKRVVIAGGDTSSYAARAMEIEALEMIAPFVSGAPLCKVHSKDAAIQGLEVNLKGGQVGSENYFVKAVGAAR